MYATVGKYLWCGDIFGEVPIPVFEGHAFTSEAGPAMLIDGTCAVCKKDLQRRFNFAPLFPLTDFPSGDHGNIRKGIIKRLFHLPAHEALEDDEFVVDLQAVFSLPRSYFTLGRVELTDDGREGRWEVTGPEAQRVLALDEVGQRALKDQIAGFFELARKKAGEQPTLDST